MAKHKKDESYTPERFHSEFLELATMEPNAAAEVATTWRERFENRVAQTREIATGGLEIALAGLSAFGISIFNGAWEERRDAIVEEWQMGRAAAEGQSPESDPFRHGEDDPTKLFGIDKVLLYTLLWTGLYLAFGGRSAEDDGDNRFGPMLKALALGGAAYWAGTVGQDLGKKRELERMAREEEEQVQEAA